jgi:hypothetical protein
MIPIVKASKEGDIASQYRRHFFPTNFANVNEP